jgi:hypothetical protein
MVETFQNLFAAKLNPTLTLPLNDKGREYVFVIHNFNPFPYCLREGDWGRVKKVDEVLKWGI